jgi:DeoR/GlpR family transcriptional regulator of sugar metabolism
LLFLGVDGFDVHHGLSTPNLLAGKVNRVMVEVAKKTVPPVTQASSDAAACP